MKIQNISLILVLTFLAGFPISGNRTPFVSTSWQAKVDPWVMESAALGKTEFLVFLSQQANLSWADHLRTKSEKGAYVFARLTETANRTQKKLIGILQAQGVEYRSFWVANMVWVRSDAATLQQIAQLPDVAHIYANPHVRLESPRQDIQPPQSPQSIDTIEWNLTRVDAPEVWAAGYTGQGVVIGGQDTGYQWDHPALKGKYRGWDGAIADHNYNWHDAIHTLGGGGICGPDSPSPCDDQIHGTHTMGIMVGDDGAGNQIGMAPGARWIGCRNMDQGVGTPATYSECYQWFIAPTDLNDQNPQPALAPDVINNSWSCPTSEGCTDPNVLRTVVENVRAAGIVTVQAASNLGSACSTINSPAAIYDASFTVGATGYTDDITYYSSRGPVTVDGSNRMKPDVSAPGDGVRSSIPTNSYAYLGGTSMAAPLVAGLVALLISAYPGLAGNVDLIEALITQNAVPKTTAQNCGGSGMAVPNNVYGWGRINANQAASNAALNLRNTPESAFYAPGELITYNLEVSRDYPSGVTNVVLTDTVPANTTFISATQPYTQNGNVVEWDFPSLGAGETQTVQLVVQAPASGIWTILNQDYGVRSDETAVPIEGVTLRTFVANYLLFFPWLPQP
jgi:serine protease AprX